MDETHFQLDFSNTQIAFANKSDEELKKTAWLFGMMNRPWLVRFGSKLGLIALNLRLPFVTPIIKATIFKQFCGGTTLLGCQQLIDKLWHFNTLTVLDYGAEGKETEKDFNHTMTETMRAIDFAASNTSVPVVSTKITGLARLGLLEKLDRKEALSPSEENEYENVLKRIDSICHHGMDQGVGVFIDAEETWIQDSIDDIVNKMMARYNRKKVIVYNTFQMYRHDRLAYLKQSFEAANAGDYLLGAKLVRGAYMEKEAARAREMGYPNPIHSTKQACDDDFDDAVRFVVEHYERIGSCCATHNAKSTYLQAQLIHEKGIPHDHAHLNFSQLFGMSDNLTFNLAKAGYNVAKYLPFGPVRDVVPYLIRRAQENTAVSGDMSREYGMIREEMGRRGIK